MTSLRKTLASLCIAGVLTVGGAACSSSSDSSNSAKSSDSIKSSDSVNSSDKTKPSKASGSTGAWCKQYETFDKTDVDPDSEEFSKMLDAVAKDAPAEISDDINLLASAFKEMGAIDMNDTLAADTLEKKYGAEKIDAASDRLEVFMKDECGIDINTD